MLHLELFKNSHAKVEYRNEFFDWFLHSDSYRNKFSCFLLSRERVSRRKRYFFSFVFMKHVHVYITKGKRNLGSDLSLLEYSCYFTTDKSYFYVTEKTTEFSIDQCEKNVSPEKINKYYIVEN